MQDKFKKTVTLFKYLEGALAIYQCFAEEPLSLCACDPGQSRPEQVLSFAAYQPKKSRRQKEKLTTELNVCFFWLKLKMVNAWREDQAKALNRHDHVYKG